MFPSPSPRTEATRATCVDLLNGLVRDGLSLYLLAQNAHWNVRGPAFGPLHSLFGEVRDTISDHVDRLAERAATLGGIAMGEDALSAGVMIPMMPLGAIDGLAMCEPVAAGIDALVARCTEVYGRCNSAGLAADANALQDIIESTEKLGWKVRSHIIRA